VVLEYDEKILDIFEKVLHEHTGREVELPQNEALDRYLRGAFSKVLVKDPTDPQPEHSLGRQVTTALFAKAIFIGRTQSSSSGTTLHLSGVTPEGMRFYKELQERWMKEINVELLKKQVEISATQQKFAEEQNKIMEKQRVLIGNTFWIYLFIALISVVQLIIGFIQDRTVISPTSTLACLGLITVVVATLMVFSNVSLAQQENISSGLKRNIVVFTVVVAVVLLGLFLVMALVTKPSLSQFNFKNSSDTAAIVITPNVTVISNITVLLAPNSVGNQSPVLRHT
jgi:hypothetical protein